VAVGRLFITCGRQSSAERQMMINRYEFKMVLCGEGPNPEEAYKNAIEALNESPFPMPEADDIDMVEANVYDEDYNAE
jgi:hypothetical protein